MVLAAALTLESFPGLTVLEIDRSRCEREGAAELAAAIKRGAMPHLRTLRIHASNITDEGLQALAPALRGLRALTTLDLRDNPISFVGYKALLEPRKPRGAALPNLTTLHLHTWLFGLNDFFAFAELVRQGRLPNIADINLFGGGLPKEATRAVRDAVTQRMLDRYNAA